MGKNTVPLRDKWWRGELTGKVTRLRDGYVVCSDALALLQQLPKGCADIVFLDPPFNLGKTYGTRRQTEDRIEDHEYYHYVNCVISRAISVLRKGGALYLYHIPRWAAAFANILNEHLDFRHWIAISMKNGFVRGERLYPAHYALLYFTKGSPKVFKRPKIALQRCRHCDKPIKDYGGYKRFVAQGLNLSDFWEDVSPVRHAKHKNRDSNELPVEIFRRVIEMSGCQDGLFVDPFAGAGSSLIVARDRAMRFVAGDIEPKYCRIMIERLRNRRAAKPRSRG